MAELSSTHGTPLSLKLVTSPTITSVAYGHVSVSES
jgi:hypothetical protein